MSSLRGTALRTAAVLVVCSGSIPAQTPPPDTAADTAWRAHLAFLAAGTGVWIASNAAYRTAGNGEPAEYGQHYRMGLGGTTQHGCLWGEYPDQKPVFWHFFTAWDPSKRQLLVHQASGNGTIGIGYESIETGVAEQIFTRPDGVSWASKHVFTRPSADTLVTQSFEKQNGEWQPRRTYHWVRQATASPPC